AQNKLRKEVTALVADNPHPDYRSLKDSPFLDPEVQAHLRPFPLIPMTLHKAAKDTEIDGTFIPEGNLIFIPIRVFNTWKEHWGTSTSDDSGLLVRDALLQISSLTMVQSP
ncbi:hypothetical protein BV22DRAFT_1019178, partial [Leucogyrophana mollusca]